MTARPAAKRLLVLVVLALSLACRRSPARRPPEGYLFEKGAYQGFYDPSGKLIRLLYDQNGDKKADVVMLFYPNGRIRQVEADTNLDGVVDRWQYYRESGALEKEGTATRAGAKQPDTWLYFDAAGAMVRREVDEDGDGQVDRTETYLKGQLTAVGLDTNRDGKIERWQTWMGGRMVSEELDLDGDGIADRRLRYTPRGTLAGVDVLGPSVRAATSR